MDFGDTLKNIRRSRGIPQQLLSNDLMSRTSVSKIENNKQVPTYPKAMKLIDLIGLTPNEFEYIRRGYKYTPKQEIIERFIHLSQSTQEQQLVSLSQDCHRFLQTNNDSDIRRICLVITALLNLEIKNISEIREIVRPVWSFLAQIDNWTKLDLYLINNILYFFPEDTALSMTNNALKNIHTKYPYLQKLETAFVMNECQLLIASNKIIQAKKLIPIAMDLAKKSFRYDYLLLLKARLAICNKEFDEVEVICKTLRNIEATDLLKGIQREVKQFKDQNNSQIISKK